MKKSVTLRIDETLYKNAQVMAILEKTKISHVVEAFLRDYSKNVDITRADLRGKKK